MSRGTVYTVDDASFTGTVDVGTKTGQVPTVTIYQPDATYIVPWSNVSAIQLEPAPTHPALPPIPNHL